MTPLIETRGLNVHFGGVHATRDVNFSLGAGNDTVSTVSGNGVINLGEGINSLSAGTGDGEARYGGRFKPRAGWDNL